MTITLRKRWFAADDVLVEIRTELGAIKPPPAWHRELYPLMSVMPTFAACLMEQGREEPLFVSEFLRTQKEAIACAMEFARKSGWQVVGVYKFPCMK